MRNSVGEPYRRGKSWYFTCTDPDGKRRESKAYGSETGAKKAATTLRNQMAAAAAKAAVTSADDIPEPDGSLGWFFDVLARKTRDVAAGGTADERNDLRAIAAACAAAKNLYDQSQLEKEVAELKEFRRAMELEREHVIRTERRAQGAPQVDEPGRPVRRHGDPADGVPGD